MRRPRLFRAVAPLAVAAGLLPLAGCQLEPDLDGLLWAMEGSVVHASVRPQFEIQVGGSALGLVRGLCGVVGDEVDCAELSRLTRDIERVDVGVYRLYGESLYEGGPVADDLARLDDRLDEEGWTTVLHTRDGREECFVLVQLDRGGEELRRVALVVREDEQLVMVSLRGELGRALDDALRRSGTMRAASRELPEQV